MQTDIKSAQNEFSKLQTYKKIVLFLYILFSIYRGICIHPLFFFGIFLPFFYLTFFQKRRVKAFFRILNRDTKVRLTHYYEDFYYIWIFVNASVGVLVLCVLVIYNFQQVENYLLTKGIPFVHSLSDFKIYTYWYFILVLLINLFTNLYIIWYKNTQTILKVVGSSRVYPGLKEACLFSSKRLIVGPENNKTIKTVLFDMF
nr:hypothetical protein [Nitzschia traheaformis]